MATYPLAWVGKAPSSEKLSLTFRQGAMQSPFTLQQQVVNTASQWKLQFTWPRMTFPQAEVCNAWLDSLRGMVGTFYYQPQAAYTSNVTGITLSAAGYAYNNAVSGSGWAAGGASGLRLGQYLQIDDQLLRITTAPANADASGHCTIEFEPALRTDFAAGTAINFTDPHGKFRLATADGYSFSLDSDRLPTFETIVALEAVE